MSLPKNTRSVSKLVDELTLKGIRSVVNLEDEMELTLAELEGLNSPTVIELIDPRIGPMRYTVF